MPPKKTTSTKKATKSNGTPNKRRGNRLNNSNIQGATPSSTKKTIEHRVYVIRCHFNILAIQFARVKPDGTVIDAYHYDFTSGMTYSDFDCDGLKMLRISADSNAGKPKSSDPTRYYKEMVLVRLSEDHDNPLLTEGVIFDYAKEAAGWGELIAKGLNETNWRYPETYMKFPWKYGGISTSHTGVEVACLDQVFLNHDVCDIVKALYGGEMPASIPEDVLDLIFSDRENNNAYEILGIKDPEDSDEEDSDEDSDEWETKCFLPQEQLSPFQRHKQMYMDIP